MTFEQFIEISKIALPLLGGGAVGALITAFVTNRRNKIQPVAKTVNISNIFVPNALLGEHITKITFSGSTANYHFENLFIAQIRIENQGNKDIDIFDFGITLPNDVLAININSNGADRHHLVSNIPEINFENPSNTIDFKLQPFNRNDNYTINLFLTSKQNEIKEQIVFSSKMPVKFIDKELININTKELLYLILRTSFNPSFTFTK